MSPSGTTVLGGLFLLRSYQTDKESFSEPKEVVTGYQAQTQTPVLGRQDFSRKPFGWNRARRAFYLINRSRREP